MQPNPDLPRRNRRASALAQGTRARKLVPTKKALANENGAGCPNACGQTLRISLNFAHLAEIERTNYTEISPFTES